MQEPPIYSTPLPPKKKNGCLIWGLAIGGTCVCCLAIFAGGGLFFGKKGLELVGCTIQFDAIHQSLQDYARDHKGQLPKATTWMDDIRPYYKKEVAQLKEGAKFLNVNSGEGTFQCEQNGDTTGIAFNKDLSGKKLEAIKDPYKTIMIFETERPALNLSETYKERSKATSPKILNEPRGWITQPVEGDAHMGDKPAPRSRVRDFGNGRSSTDVSITRSSGDDEGGDTPPPAPKPPKKP